METEERKKKEEEEERVSLLYSNKIYDFKAGIHTQTLDVGIGATESHIF